jgi:acyl carrier protein
MSIEQDLKDYIAKSLARSGVTLEDDTNLAEAVDSTAMMELVVWIADHYGFDVEIDDITPDHFGTIRRLSDYIRKHKK